MRRKTPSKRLKIGRLYSIYDSTNQIPIDYGVCVFVKRSYSTMWARTDHLGRKIYKYYPIVEFYSLSRNETFYFWISTLNWHGGACLEINDINGNTIFKDRTWHIYKRGNKK
jgi:hypothetical protein